MRTDIPSLERECSVFTRCLIGSGPDEYVTRKYVEAHRVCPSISTGSRLDELMLRVASAGPWMVRFPDSYARWFRPDAALRKKLIVLLAILETSAPSYKTIDAVPGPNRVAVLARLLGFGCGAVLSLLVGTAVFVPCAVLLPQRKRGTA